MNVLRLSEDHYLTTAGNAFADFHVSKETVPHDNQIITFTFGPDDVSEREVVDRWSMVKELPQSLDERAGKAVGSEVENRLESLSYK